MISFFDAALLSLIVGGGVWGYASGGFKITVKLGFIVAPSIALAYFGSDIAAIGTTLAGMLKDRISAPLGLVGASSAMIGMIGVVGSFFFGSRIAIAVMDLHEPSTREKSIGAAIGMLGLLALVTPLFIFIVKTFPAPAQKLVLDAKSWPYIEPALIAVHKPIDDFIERRMAGLANGLSDNQMIARLAAGQTPSASGALRDVMGKIRDIDLQEVFRLQKAARKLDPKEVEKLLAAYKSGDMSRERLKSHLENPDFQSTQ